MALSKAQINSISNFDLRTVLLGLYDAQDQANQALGINFPQASNNSLNPASAPPSAPSVTATGANGTISVTITPPTQSLNKALFYELSYSTQSNFTSGVTTQPPTNSTFTTIPMPGSKVYVRVRASYDSKNWSGYAYA